MYKSTQQLYEEKITESSFVHDAQIAHRESKKGKTELKAPFHVTERLLSAAYGSTPSEIDGLNL